MIRFYNWLVCKLFKKCEIELPAPKKTSLEIYCDENPWARECRIYED